MNSEAVAEPIVATLVGSIGLIAAVPVTTALAAVFGGELFATGCHRLRPLCSIDAPSRIASRERAGYQLAFS